MVYVDTNVLIYIAVNQGDQKRDIAEKLVRELIKNDELFLSPLTIQEYIFTLAKLKIDLTQIAQDVDFYLDYVQQSIDKEVLIDAFTLCRKINYCKNINDVIHLKVAEQYCRKLITFDSDFKKLKNKAKIKIEILNSD